MNTKVILFLVPIIGAAALLNALIRTRWIYKQDVSNHKLREISGYVQEGAMTFLSREYKVLVPFVLAVAAFLAVANQGVIRFQALSFIVGSLASGLAGFIGMRVATSTNSRTTQAAQEGINPALKTSFAGGSVMGLSVVGLALLGLSLVLITATAFLGDEPDTLMGMVFPILSGFSLGASSIALFSRVGGGIFTKAADVGADLVGKVEAGIPEDDPRNPASIADNVGDNVGDVAGMGADLFESYVGSIVGSMILGITLGSTAPMRLRLAFLPLILAGVGVLASMIGVFFVRVRPGVSPQRGLNRGTIGAALLSTAAAYPVIHFVLAGGTLTTGAGALGVFFALILGLAAGVIIGLLTEFYTGTNMRPVNRIVKATETGAATTIISGLGVGMLSCFPTIIIIAAAILGSFFFAGFYGVSMAALGMLLTLGIQLAVDAFGPIADNAGGLAVMCEFEPEVREITDELDSVGNTTAAIGKGFAIGSAAMTSIILFSAFQASAGVTAISLTDVPTLTGLLVGAAIPYLFSALAMDAVGKAAYAMVEEVRRQFRELPGILTETEKPDYNRCVGIATESALKQMILPGLIAALTPVAVGFLGGIQMLSGLLAGVTASGVMLAVFMSNSGGAWDNAKKMVEAGAAGGKGSDPHKASVIGDTVGDPFKDTAGPALNILIKLMAVVSLVIAPMLKTFWN